MPSNSLARDVQDQDGPDVLLSINSSFKPAESAGDLQSPQRSSTPLLTKNPENADGEIKDGSALEGPPLELQEKKQLELSPEFPQLSHTPVAAFDGQAKSLDGEDKDEDLFPSKPALRPANSTAHRAQPKEASFESEGNEGSVRRMYKFSLYETATRYYVVGSDVLDSRFRILKIDRTAEADDLSITEDDTVYNKEETQQLLRAIDDGNKSTGGMKLRSSTWGILGFIRFTGPYYMLLITRRSQVAMLGGHYVYQIDGTELVPLTAATSRFKPDRNSEESRFLTILNNLDLSRAFYYSYSYDITRTLQRNISRERDALLRGLAHPEKRDYNDMFAWNHYLLEPVSRSLKKPYDWCLPIIHGFVDQATISIYGRSVYVTIIARRSRYFAGARFLKRGANDLGYVANDVETEQIVSEMLTTSFHAPGPRLYSNPSYTSYVQHRGSIPLYWTQDNTGVTPKPPININLVDPFYGAAALHFDNLFERYGTPVYVLNLVKARERTPRESKLLKEFTNAIYYLNQFLPADKKIIYKTWDMSRASKSRDQDVIGTLEAIGEEVMKATGFFHNGEVTEEATSLQQGVCRTNCIDCLDRTNAAQFVIGKRALGHQLHALGVIADTSIDYDTDAVNLFTHMYHDHGDIIAVQYGGSHLVNTMETYRKINHWTSHSRDMVESFKRYYNNSFLDAQRQEAYNLFLGNYIFAQGQPMLWDLATDYYLHNAVPRLWSEKNRRSYTKWYTPEFLAPREMPPAVTQKISSPQKLFEFIDDYWLEYYRPLAVSSFLKIFSYKMNSTLRYIPLKLTQEGKYDLSPFRVRTGNDQVAPEKKKVRKGVKILEPKDELIDDAISLGASEITTASKRISIQRWLQPQVAEKLTFPHGIIKEPHKVHTTPSVPSGFSVVDQSLSAQWTLEQFVEFSLNPTVTQREAAEYARYINHPFNLPLVVSSELPPDPSSDIIQYVNSTASGEASSLRVAEDDIFDFGAYVQIPENPLTVNESDAPKKRYKAYKQWLKGKPLFKQQKADQGSSSGVDPASTSIDDGLKASKKKRQS